MKRDEQFFAKLGNSGSLLELFDVLPGVSFFVKDRAGRFVAINDAFLTMLGLKGADGVLGKLDRDFFDQELAALYRGEDEVVLTSGKAVRDEVWWVPNLSSGEVQWYSSTKIPLMDGEGRAVGVAGIMCPLEKAVELSEDYRMMGKVGRYIEKNYDKRITLRELAELAGLSERHFQRVFARLFRSGPTEHLLRVRIRAASRRLAESGESLAEIATRCGFYDQAHFTNQFRRFRGVTPLDYRRRFRVREAAGEYPGISG